MGLVAICSNPNPPACTIGVMKLSSCTLPPFLQANADDSSKAGWAKNVLRTAYRSLNFPKARWAYACDLKLLQVDAAAGPIGYIA